MKKRFLSVICLIAVCSAVCCFTACSLGEAGSNPGSPSTGEESSSSNSSSEQETNIYDTLNVLAEKEYQKVTLTLTVTQGENTLTDNYTVNKTEKGYTVDYTYMRANPIEGKDGAYVLPEEYATTYKGTAVYENGKQVSHTGADLDYSVSTSLNVRFAQSYFSAWTESDGEVNGTVANGSAFGGNTAYNNATFSLKYTEVALQSFTLRYVDGSATVSAVYRLEA
jgi:hypothetical protein